MASDLDLKIRLSFEVQCGNGNMLGEVMRVVANEGHFDHRDLVFGLIGASDSMGNWGMLPLKHQLEQQEAQQRRLRDQQSSACVEPTLFVPRSSPLLLPYGFANSGLPEEDEENTVSMLVSPTSQVTNEIVDGAKRKKSDEADSSSSSFTVFTYDLRALVPHCNVLVEGPSTAATAEEFSGRACFPHAAPSSSHFSPPARYVEARLVVWNTRLGCIVGVDNARTEPSLIIIGPIPEATDEPASSTATGIVSFTFRHDVPGGAGRSTWQAELLQKEAQMPLSASMAENPLASPLVRSHIISTAAMRGIDKTSQGPYLHLIFYPHRNDLPFDANEWLSTIPAAHREAFEERRHTCCLRLTKATMMESSFINWSAFDGSAARARAGLATCALPAPAMSVSLGSSLGLGGVSPDVVSTIPSGNATVGVGVGAGAATPYGCPVPEPLRVVEPIREGPAAKGIRDSATMVSWTASYDLSLLTHHIPVVEFEGYTVDDPTTPHKGSFCLLPDMFMLRDQTNGVSGVAAVSDDKRFIAPLYISYSVIRPFFHSANNFRAVRSIEAFEKLHFRTVMGHRGIGKTYTDSVATQKMRVQKFSENSISSFVAALHRGAGAVEFDVMMTSDRVPVVCHEPVFTVETATAGGKHMQRAEVYVHQVTKKQLDSIVKEAVPAGGDVQYRLKTLLEFYWRNILDIARSKKSGGVCKTRCRGCGGTGTIGYPANISSGDAGRRTSDEEAAVFLTSSHQQNPAHNASPSILFGVTPTTLVREQRRRDLVDSIPFIANTPSHRDKHILTTVPTLADVMESVPPALSFNIEVKFPFQPQADRNLHLQRDAFEINRYCDLVLDVCFRYLGQGREIGFSSFDPDICTALMLKQTRYHVLFLADCDEKFDQKDYRSWGVEAPVQYAMGERLAGVSIPSRSLLTEKDVVTVLRNKVIMPRYVKDSVANQTAKQDDGALTSVDLTFGEGIVRACRTRGLRVWTWGGANDNLQWCALQKSMVGVTGIITDNIPPPPALTLELTVTNEDRGDARQMEI